MRLLIYADLQATDGNEVCFANPTKTLQHYRVEKFFKDMERIYQEQKCAGVIDLGDTTDDRTSIPVPTIEILGTGLNRIPNSDWNFKLTGNHEQYLRNAEVNNRHLFAHKFNVIDEREIFQFDNCMAFFCSFTTDVEGLVQWLREGLREYRNYAKILFGHFEVVGAQLNSGLALQGVPVNILKQFKLCLLGHVHIPQTISKSIHYVGSPFQQDWGEAGEAKRVAVLDTQDLSLTWIPMTGYPEYSTVTLDEYKVASQWQTENRFKVTLTTHAEAEQFFLHPKFQLAEPVYAYDAPEANKDQPVITDWSFEGIAKRYLAFIPPSAAGIEYSHEDLLELGKLISAGRI